MERQKPHKQRYHHSSAHWVSGTDVIDIDTSHVQAIIDVPERFGLTSEHVQSRYTAHGERIGFEGKARDELVMDACRNGWGRGRRYTQGPGDYWSFQIDTVTRIRETVRPFVESMVNDSIMSPNDELQIVAVDDNVVLPYAFGNGGVQRFLRESEIAIPRSRYHVHKIESEVDRLVERVFQGDMSEAISQIDPISRGSVQSYKHLHAVLYTDGPATPRLIDRVVSLGDLNGVEIEGYRNLVDKIRVDREYPEITLRAIVETELSTSPLLRNQLENLSTHQVETFWSVIDGVDRNIPNYGDG